MRTLRPIVTGIAVLLAAGSLASQQAITAEEFRRHVSWLADDARAGRQTGSPELEETAAYVASVLADHGLVAVEGQLAYRQPFQALGGRQLVEGNALTVAGLTLELERDWVPFSSSAAAEVEAPLVFAGYGIVDEEAGYDDYAGLDVEGKLVVVLRRGPGATQRAAQGMAAAADDPAPPDRRAEAAGVASGAGAEGGSEADAVGQDPGARWLDPAGQGRHLIAFATKINTAFQRGAAGLLVVNDPATTPPGGEGDTLVPFGSGGVGGATASFPAVHLTAAAGQRVLGQMGVDLLALQSELDETLAPRSSALGDDRARVVIATEREEVTTVNVVAMRPGDDPERAHEYVVLGAHMDHLGHGRRSGSMGGSEAVGQIHNGADDNASGVAGLLEASGLLAGRVHIPRTIVFVAFGAEEWGLLGSEQFVDEPPLPLEDCVAMVNLDMIGRSVDGAVTVNGVGSASEDALWRLLRDANEELEQPLELQPGPGVQGNSDHYPFFQAGIPVLNFFTGLHDDYHRPSDDVEKIEVGNGTRIAELAALCVEALAGGERLVFVDPDAARKEAEAAAAAPGDQASPHEGQDPPQAAAAYRVVFGTIPDMTYQQDDGVRLSGVREGQPAQKAGLLAGDVIVAFDGKPVRNLEDYAVLLFAHRPGETITVTVRRGEEELQLSAVLEGRGGDS